MKTKFKQIIFTLKIASLACVLIILPTIFSPLIRHFIFKLPEAFSYFQMWLAGTAVPYINVANDEIGFYSLLWLGGFSYQLSVLGWLTGLAIIFCTCIALLIITIIRYKSKNTLKQKISLKKTLLTQERKARDPRRKKYNTTLQTRN